ncbi:hypothetical protein LJC27_01870 [Christensenellaceae bacterium OttesenSCG-928-M15]|nr:hypothetical protein [Christensenellaceae bacterium OttesenSCG-928-M15]
MANNLEFAEIYQDFIDEELVAESKSGWMTPQDDLIEYEGGDTVKIAEIDVSGLGDYDRNNTATAYPAGSVTTKWRDYIFAQDRAVEFQLDRLDPGDTRYTATAENVVREFARTKLVREQDMYRYNRVYAAIAGNTDLAPTHVVSSAGITAANILSVLNGLKSTVEDDSESTMELVCAMPLTLKNLIPETSSTNRHRVFFGESVSINGVVYDDVTIVNDLPILWVPTKRLQTVIKINDGRTAGQTQGGIDADSTSKQIYGLICGIDAIKALGKLDELKVFGNEENQRFSGTAIQSRYVYDAWAMYRKMATIGAIIAE